MKKIILLLLGIVYYYLIQVSIHDLKPIDKLENTFSFTVKSHINHHIDLHIGSQVYMYKISKLSCKEEEISFNNKIVHWFEREGGEEVARFNINKGENICYAEVEQKNILSPERLSYLSTPIIKQKITSLNFFILFALIGLPLLSFIFHFFIYVLQKIKNKLDTQAVIEHDSPNTINSKYTIFIFSILIIAVLLRIFYYQKFSVYYFQHDWQGHIEFFKYLSMHETLPLPSQGLQFPQQPLYYFLTSKFYDFLMYTGIGSKNIIHSIGYFSLLSSFIFLYYAYKFFTLISKNIWVIIIATLFISFTPSLVYISARINNDVLVMSLSAFSLYYLIKSYQLHFTKYFYITLLGISLLFMTKISAAGLEILFFSLLLIVYIQEKNTKNIQAKLFIFSGVGIFLLSYTLWRVYLPIEGTFHFVNSSGYYQNQHIPSLDTSFFTYFNLQQLFSWEVIDSYTKDTALYTFPNHQYRTMLIGEFNYTEYLQNTKILEIIIKILFFLGFIYLIGFFSYLHYLWKTKGVHRLLFSILVLNLILILKFVFTYPSICNTDFRYFVPSFLIIAYIFAQGIVHISINRYIGYLFAIIIALLTMSELLFLSLLIFS